MKEISVPPAQAIAVAAVLRAAGFVDATPTSGATVAALTAGSERAVVLVRIVPQRAAARHPFVTLISATCRRHRACGWRAQLGADVPAQVIASFAQAVLSTSVPCGATSALT